MEHSSAFHKYICADMQDDVGYPRYFQEFLGILTVQALLPVGNKIGGYKAVCYEISKLCMDI